MTFSNSSFHSIPGLLKSCTTVTQLQKIHAQIVRYGLENDHFLISQLICLCQNLSALSYSNTVFDSITSPNTCLWNILIKGYCKNSRFDEAISVFIRMKRENGFPDSFTYPLLIKSCVNEARVREGKAFHGSAMRSGVDKDVFVRTSLIDFYGKFGGISLARNLFDEMLHKNVVSWTAMIVGYVFCGDLAESVKLFRKTPWKNSATWNVMIGGFVKAGDLSEARILFEAMPEKNAISFTMMIDGYAKHGDMASARLLFDESPHKDIFIWSALISGLVQNSQLSEAITAFRDMIDTEVKPDEYVLVSLMSACSQLGNPKLAEWVDDYVLKSPIKNTRTHVNAALIDMNAKTGNLSRAKTLFEATPQRDLVTYCSMMQGFSVHGLGKDAVLLFDRMVDDGYAPDKMAFIIVLTACSRAGLVKDGLRLFESLKTNHSLELSPDHYVCMVDLLGRTGNTRAAFELLESMPIGPHTIAWETLLGACKLHCETELAELVAARLIGIEARNPGNYVLLSQIYAESERWDDVSLARDRIKEKGLRKVSGRSWISSER